MSIPSTPINLDRPPHLVEKTPPLSCKTVDKFKRGISLYEAHILCNIEAAGDTLKKVAGTAESILSIAIVFHLTTTSASLISGAFVISTLTLATSVVVKHSKKEAIEKIALFALLTTSPHLPFAIYAGTLYTLLKCSPLTLGTTKLTDLVTQTWQSNWDLSKKFVEEEIKAERLEMCGSKDIKMIQFLNILDDYLPHCLSYIARSQLESIEIEQYNDSIRQALTQERTRCRAKPAVEKTFSELTARKSTKGNHLGDEDCSQANRHIPGSPVKYSRSKPLKLFLKEIWIVAQEVFYYLGKAPSKKKRTESSNQEGLQPPITPHPLGLTPSVGNKKRENEELKSWVDERLNGNSSSPSKRDRHSSIQENPSSAKFISQLLDKKREFEGISEGTLMRKIQDLEEALSRATPPRSEDPEEELHESEVSIVSDPRFYTPENREGIEDLEGSFWEIVDSLGRTEKINTINSSIRKIKGPQPSKREETFDYSDDYSEDFLAAIDSLTSTEALSEVESFANKVQREAKALRREGGQLEELASLEKLEQDQFRKIAETKPSPSQDPSTTKVPLVDPSMSEARLLSRLDIGENCLDLTFSDGSCATIFKHSIRTFQDELDSPATIYSGGLNKAELQSMVTFLKSQSTEQDLGN